MDARRVFGGDGSATATATATSQPSALSDTEVSFEMIRAAWLRTMGIDAPAARLSNDKHRLSSCCTDSAKRVWVDLLLSLSTLPMKLDELFVSTPSSFSTSQRLAAALATTSAETDGIDTCPSTLTPGGAAETQSAKSSKPNTSGVAGPLSRKEEAVLSALAVPSRLSDGYSRRPDWEILDAYEILAVPSAHRRALGMGDADHPDHPPPAVHVPTRIQQAAAISLTVPPSATTPLVALTESANRHQKRGAPPPLLRLYSARNTGANRPLNDSQLPHRVLPRVLRVHVVTPYLPFDHARSRMPRYDWQIDIPFDGRMVADIISFVSLPIAELRTSASSSVDLSNLPCHIRRVTVDQQVTALREMDLTTATPSDIRQRMKELRPAEAQTSTNVVAALHRFAAAVSLMAIDGASPRSISIVGPLPLPLKIFSSSTQQSLSSVSISSGGLFANLVSFSHNVPLCVSLLAMELEFRARTAAVAASVSVAPAGTADAESETAALDPRKKRAMPPLQAAAIGAASREKSPFAFALFSDALLSFERSAPTLTSLEWRGIITNGDIRTLLAKCPGLCGRLTKLKLSEPQPVGGFQDDIALARCRKARATDGSMTTPLSSQQWIDVEPGSPVFEFSSAWDVRRILEDPETKALVVATLDLSQNDHPPANMAHFDRGVNPANNALISLFPALRSVCLPYAVPAFALYDIFLEVFNPQSLEASGPTFCVIDPLRLTSLNLTECSPTERDVEWLIRRAKNLTSFRLHSYHVPKTIFKLLAEHCPHLERIMVCQPDRTRHMKAIDVLHIFKFSSLQFLSVGRTNTPDKIHKHLTALVERVAPTKELRAELQAVLIAHHLLLLRQKKQKRAQKQKHEVSDAGAANANWVSKSVSIERYEAVKAALVSHDLEALLTLQEYHGAGPKQGFTKLGIPAMHL